MVVVPWVELLKYRQDSRIFQDKDIKQILSTIFGDLGFSDFSWKLQKTYEPREYCVQYRETNLDFAHRLLEEEGIYYYFKHEEGKHTLILSDYVKGYDQVPVGTFDVVDGSHTNFTIKRWNRDYNFLSGKVELNDYNFTTPATDLTAFQKSLVSIPNIDKFEVYNYPGEYKVKGEGTNYSTVQMEALESVYTKVNAESDYPGMCPGHKITVGDHWDKAEKGKKYVLLYVEHNGTDGNYRSGEGDNTYSNKLVFAPAETLMRPLITTPKPEIAGSQTAVVVGPSGEEIYTDEYGRIKVQFHWDRHGANDEKSSCWIRVAQFWAGKKWGAQYIPRIGQEAVISFMEGDPDRPLVIGSVYNAEQMPPYEVPSNKTHSGVKSRSSKEGGTANYNEIMFIDEKGSELLRVHAEKDRGITVENDDTEDVGHDQSITIGNDQTENVGHDQTIDVGNDQKETIGRHRTTSVGKNDSLSVGQNQSISVEKDQSISISGNKVENITGSSNLSVEKEMGVAIEKDLTETVKGKHTESVTKEYALDAKKIQITAKDQITIKVGKASITMKKNGDITINGNKITGKASGVMTLKGSQIKEN